MPATRQLNSSVSAPFLYLGFDLGEQSWRLTFTVGYAQTPRGVTVRAGAVEELQRQIAAAKRKFQLPAETAVRSCYEAGREGFWLHRWLTAQGVDNVVVDSASLEVDRRQRRAKTDRLDSAGLVRMLVRFHSGDARTFRVVRVPSAQEEAARHLHRALKTWIGEETAIINRIKGCLAGVGLKLEPNGFFLQRLKAARQWNGEPIAEELRDRVLADFALLQAVRRQIQKARTTQRGMIRRDKIGALKQVKALLGLQGVGVASAWTLSKELFGWRTFRNRREVGALAGLAPTPYQSGTLNHECGISRAGNRWVRGIIVELAWSWLRHQPESALSRWYARRFAHEGARLRKRGIVAVARKLLVALWSYLQTGVPPAGAVLADWRRKIQKRKSLAACGA